MDMPDPRVGTVLAGRYKILERSSAGSMGVVYRAERVSLKRAVAIKFLSEGYAATQDGLRRFEVEARAMSRLEHPNCVAVTDYGLVDGAPYLVMDFVKGVTLAQLLAQEWRLTPARAVSIMRQVVAGLAHAHAQRIIHRDVKPANILISFLEGSGDHVRIVDFGLAKLRDEGSFTTGVAVGTPSYMSPEQTIGQKADERADVYACGVIFYELLTGAKPFQAETPFEVMRMHRETAPVPLSTAAQGVQISQRLEALVMKAMAKAPSDRFQDMTEFRAALEEVDEAHGKASGKSGRVAVAAIAIAALGVGGFFGWRALSRDDAAAAVASGPAVAGGTEPATPGIAPGAGGAAGVRDEVLAGAAVDAPPPPPIDAADDPAPPPDAAAEPPLAAQQIARLRSLATDEGNLAGAIAGLIALRKAQAMEPEVHYALANTYAENQQWPEALGAYAKTIDLDASYRENPRLIADVVEALGSRKAYKAATRMIERQLKAAALPELDEASRSTNKDLRTRARKLRDRLR